MRTCVGCRGRDLRSELLRLVLPESADDHEVVVDTRKDRPGRGAWIHPDTACLDLAVRRRAVPRALRVAGPLDLAVVREHLEQQDRRTLVGADRRPTVPTGHDARPHHAYVDKEAGQKPMGTR